MTKSRPGAEDEAAIRAEVRSAMTSNPLFRELPAATIRAWEGLEVERRRKTVLDSPTITFAWPSDLAYTALGILTVLGLVLRCVGVASRDLWTDEAAKIAFARLPIASLMTIVTGGYEENPPAYFILLGLVISSFDDSLLSYRLISLISGVLTIPAAYFLGTELYSNRLGLCAALLAALSPYLLWYSQDASPYSLLGLLCTLSLWAFLRALRTNRPSSWLAYSTVTATAMYIHYYAILLPALQACYLIGVYGLRDRCLARRASLAIGGIALLYLPQVPLAAAQLGAARQAGYVGRSPLAYAQTVITNTLNLGNGYRLAEFSDILQSATFSQRMSQAVELFVVVIIPIGIACAGVLAAIRLRSSAGAYVLWMFGGLSLIGASTLFLARHLIIAAVLYIVLMALAVGYSRGTARAVMLALLVGVDLLSLQHFYTSSWSRSKPQDWAGAARLFVEDKSPGDMVAVDAWIGGAFAFSHGVWSVAPGALVYGSGEADGQLPRTVPESWAKMSPQAIKQKLVYAWRVTRDGQLREVTEPSLASGSREAARLEELVCETCRLWVVYDSWDADGWPIGLAALEEHMSRVEVHNLAPYLRLMVLSPRVMSEAG